jgi:hypothetical protein
LGFPTGRSYTKLLHQHRTTNNFSGAVAGEKEDFCKGSLSLPIFYFVIVLLYFIFACIFLSKIQKISSFIVVIFTCLLLVLLEWVILRTRSCVILLAPITMILSALLLHHLLLRKKIYEIKPALLNLVMKEQFSGVSTDDAAAHLNYFVELCEMQKYKDVDA